jgi:hypothetical protein
MDIDEGNRWAVYPIDKTEAANKKLSEAITIARQAQHIEECNCPSLPYPHIHYDFD